MENGQEDEIGIFPAVASLRRVMQRYEELEEVQIKKIKTFLLEVKKAAEEIWNISKNKNPRDFKVIVCFSGNYSLVWYVQEKSLAIILSNTCFTPRTILWENEKFINKAVLEYLGNLMDMTEERVVCLITSQF
jgi:hypothetical protein